MKTLQLDIVTPERSVFSGEANGVIIPGSEGDFAVLPNHDFLISQLRIGVLRILMNEKKDDLYVAVSGGFVEAKPDRVVVLANTAEREDEIDIQRAQLAKERAEERLRRAKEENIDFARAQAALQRAMVRLKVAKGIKD